MKEKVLKKKKLILCCVAILLIVAVALCLLFSCGNHKASVITPPSDSESISRTPPEDGSTPEDYEGLDNIAYIIGRLAGREVFHTEGVSNVTASVMFIKAGQTVYSSKDYKNGILLTTAVSISGNAFAPSKAIQRFFGDGKAVVREAASPVSEWKGSDVEWKTGEPSEILDTAQYEERYGLWASEFSDYVINENTVLEITPVEKTEDGLYTFTATLDSEESTYYYKHSMVTMGDLDDYPVFSSVKMTFTFGADWTIYTLAIDENYTSRKGVDADCVGNTVITYSYDEAAADVSDYDEYFVNYADADTTGATDKELTAGDYLTYGFASFLTDEVSLDADVTVAGETLSAQVLLDMRGLEFNSLKGRLGSLVFAYENDKIYLSYKDLAGYLNVSDVLALLGGGAQGGISIDTDALMEQLTAAEVTKDGENVTLSATLDLGGMTVPVRFGFVERGKEVSFGYLEAELGVMGMDISVHAAMSETPADIAVPESAVDLYPFVQSIKGLAEGKNYTLGVEYSDETLGLSVTGSISADLTDGIAAAGTLNVVYGTLTVPAEFAFADGMAYVKVFGVKVCGTIEEIAEAVNAALAAADVQLPELPEMDIDVGEIVAVLLGQNFDEMIEGLSLTEGELSLTVNVDGLLSALADKEISVGDIAAKYVLLENKFTVSALGGKAKLSFGANGKELGAPADADTYVPLSFLKRAVENVQNIMESNGAAFELSLGTAIDGTKMTADIMGEVRFADGKLSSLILYIDLLVGENAKAEQLRIYYTGGELFIGYGKGDAHGYVMKISSDDLQEIQEAIEALLSENIPDEGLKGAMRFIGEMDLNKLLNSLSLLSESENAISLLADLSDILGEGNEDFSLGLSLTENGAVVLGVPSVTLFGLKVESFSLLMEPVPEEPELITDFTDWTQCSNVFEFLLRAYQTFFDSDYITLNLQYEKDGTAADLRGALRLKDVAEGVAVELSAEAVITSGDSKYYIQASVAEENVGDEPITYAYIYFSLKGFETSSYFDESEGVISADAAPLRAKFKIASLFEMSSDAMPLIISLMGLDQNGLYYFNFVVDLLGNDYGSINTGIFGKKSTEEWLELILGIIDEYTGKDENGGQADTEDDRMSVSFSLQNKTLTVSGAGLDMTLGAVESAAVSKPDTDKYPYTDYTTLAQLVSVMMDSITTSQIIEDAHGNQIRSAQINDYYYLSGSVSAMIGSKYEVANISLAAAVYIREDKSVSVHLRVYIPYTYFLTSITPIINGNTLLEMTIEDGMVYICRRAAEGDGDAESAQRVYRVMPLDSLFADFLDHMSFLFNFSGIVETLMSLIDFGGGSDGGADIGSILTSYSHSEEDGRKWTLGIDLSSFTDGVIGASTVDLAANADGVLQSLTFKTSLISFVNLNATLGYMNPGESMNGDHFDDITRDIAEEVRTLTGKTLENTDWSQTSYFEAKSATITYTLDGKEIDSQLVAYDASNELLSEIILPDLSEYNKRGYTYSWGDFVFGGSDMTVAAQKTPNEYTVTLYSAYEIDGYTPARTENGAFVYELAYTYGTRLSLPVGTEWNKTYRIGSFADKEGKTYSYIENITADIALETVWEDILYTVTYTAFGEMVYTQYYHYGEEINVPEGYDVAGFAFGGWNCDVTVAESDMTIQALYTVTVTLASDYAANADGVVFAGNDETGYFGSYSLEGTAAEDFAFDLPVSAIGYTQFGWWHEADGAWTNVASLAGLDGQTVWALWVTDFNASVTYAQKQNKSGFEGIWYSIKYDYNIEGNFAGGEISGVKSREIAEKIGLTASVDVSGSNSYNGKSHSFRTTTGSGTFTAAVYLTNGAAGSPYEYEFNCGDFNAYRVTVTKSFTCNVAGVSFGSLSVELSGNF